MTNYEKIKDMSDDEIKLLCESNKYCSNCPLCMPSVTHNICYCEIKEWLEREVEE